MSKKLFLSLTCLILVAGLFLHIYVLRGNNIFFTTDQGRDAVYVREILERGRFFTKGPETNIRGIFAGPLFYYFVAVGYFFTGGHPVGGVLMMVILNLVLTAFIIFWLKKRVGSMKALLVGGALQFFWPFFETSLWSFNPFPLVACAFLLIFSMIEFFNGNAKYYYLGFLSILLAYNAEIAGATAMFVFYLIIGFWAVKRNLITARKGFMPLITVSFAALVLGRQFVSNAVSTRVLGLRVEQPGQSAGQVLGGTNFKVVFGEFLNMLGETIIPQKTFVGLVLFGLIFYFFVTKSKFKKMHPDVIKFVFLTFLLTLVSIVFFGLTKGYRGWHVVYLPPLIFVSLLLMIISRGVWLFHFGGVKLFQIGFVFLLGFQVFNFKTKYEEYLKPNTNPSLLYNQLSVTDWIYSQSSDQGFRVYNYTDTFYDYPYQYLFWWYGRSKYEYLPDEYSNFPLSHKDLYIPGSGNYSQPARSGSGLKYLIIQSETNGEDNKDWPDKFGLYHDLIGETRVGDIKVEKYKPKNNAPSDLCIWWGQCNLLEKDNISR